MPLWLQITLTCLLSLAAAYAASLWARVSASSLDRKRLNALETEVASLTSEYSKAMGLLKKISNRVALDQHRATNSRDASTGDGAPPPPGDKAAAKMFYLHGKSHAEVARLAMRGKE